MCAGPRIDPQRVIVHVLQVLTEARPRLAAVGRDLVEHVHRVDEIHVLRIAEELLAVNG